MLIKIIRNTVAKPNGGAARAVAIGEILDVDSAQGEQLIQLRKAVVFEAGSPASQLATPEQAMPPLEQRLEQRKRSR